MAGLADANDLKKTLSRATFRFSRSTAWIWAPCPPGTLTFAKQIPSSSCIDAVAFRRVLGRE